MTEICRTLKNEKNLEGTNYLEVIIDIQAQKVSNVVSM